MHDTSVTPGPAERARRGGRAVLAQALRDSRADTLATFAVFERGLPGLQVPLAAHLNPPLWELGHIGWFQSHWVGRNPTRHAGARADPLAGRTAHDDDRLYDSSRVAHDDRWQLPLPDAAATRAQLAAGLAQTLALLHDGADDGDDTLYFFRLALHHEDMHHEAALYGAQALGLAPADVRWQPPRLPPPPPALSLPRQRLQLGSAGGGFAFDNEGAAHEVALEACRIDAQVLRWAEYLPFVEATGAAAPRYLRRGGAGGRQWQQCRGGRWQPLDLQQPACHLDWHQAQAWCRWAGRRLPSEAEWEAAALGLGADFRWGDVWEWTASPFAPYPGFVAHPYRDYSEPWFDGRPVLRGASFMTQPRLRHPRFRNFFPASRSDVPAGLRSCAL